MSQYSSYNTTILQVKPSEIQDGDIVLGPASQQLAINLPPLQLSRPRNLRRVSSLDRDDFSVPYSDRRVTARRYRRQDRQDRDLYDSADSIARKPRRRQHQPGFQDRHDSADSVARKPRRRRHQPGFQDRYDSDGSIPPRPRRFPRNNQEQKRQKSNRNRSSSSSSSSSDLGCTEDDEKNEKKAKWKKWGTIGLATVATIHAVHGAHETFEKAQARRKELAEGKISEGEAHKKKKNARLRTVAEVGIAGVWVKGAYDELMEYREAKREHVELREKSEKRHQKRLERAEAIKRGDYRGNHAMDDHDRYFSDDNDHNKRHGMF
jgi:hypothetical protein